LLLFEFNFELKDFEVIFYNDCAKSYLSDNLDKKYLNAIFDFIDDEKIKELKASGRFSFDWILNDSNTDNLLYLTVDFLSINSDDGKPQILVNLLNKTKENLKLNELEIQLNEHKKLNSEVNHRVNNNLSVIDGIIEINKIKINDEYTLEKLAEIQLKIKSIAFAYQKTNQCENIHSINIKKYISEIANYFKNTFYNEGFKTLRVKTQIPNETCLPPMKSVQLGLLLSELMFNSYKFGNPKADMVIEINIETNEDVFVMNYTDSGNGLPIDVMDLKSGSFGFKLIENLIKQLNGTYKLPVSKNFEFNLEFKN
jgi:two-component sensor histidine kinase